jgi:hypothetical protein
MGVEVLKVGTVTAGRGEKNMGTMVVEVFPGQFVLVPVIAINGAQPGPTFYIHAGQHREELSGMEAARRFAESLEPREMRGRVIVIPMVNPLHLRFYQPSVEGELSAAVAERQGERLAELWPGDWTGNAVQRLAHAIYSEAIGKADAVVDLRCCDSYTASWAEVPGWDEDSVRLGEVFGLTFMGKMPKDAAHAPGPVSAVVATSKCPAITVWLRGRDLVVEAAVGTAVMGLTAVARHLGILEGPVNVPARRFTLDESNRYIVHAECNGVFFFYGEPGQQVRPQEPLGAILEMRELAMRPIVAAGAGVIFRAGARPEERERPTFVVRRAERIMDIYRLE